MTKRTAVRRISKALDQYKTYSPSIIILFVENIVLHYLKDNMEPVKSEDKTKQVAKFLGYELLD